MVYHTLLGFCGWDIPAAIILTATIAVFVIRDRKLRKTEKELEERVLKLSSEKNSLS